MRLKLSSAQCPVKYSSEQEVQAALQPRLAKWSCRSSLNRDQSRFYNTHFTDAIAWHVERTLAENLEQEERWHCTFHGKNSPAEDFRKKSLSKKCSLLVVCFGHDPGDFTVGGVFMPLNLNIHVWLMLEKQPQVMSGLKKCVNIHSKSSFLF